MRDYSQARWEEPLLVEMSREGRVGQRIEGDPSAMSLIPEHLRRQELALPELSEPQVVRHFVRLSQMNFAIDLGFYPLGSCTMKYNPKISERLASDPRFTRLHPLQPIETAQGTLELLYQLGKMLEEITGAYRFSLAPAAGAQGELVGCLIMKAWHRDRGEEQRDEMLVPDTAHGTNPASASMAGYKVVKVPSDERGLVSVKELERLVSDRTAGIMMTVPNTLGLFERDIDKIAQLVHDAGGFLYYDGANMNALLGRVRPCDMGFDIIHLNLHKTFSTPHGGGGPGAGPVGVVKELEPYLPIPLIGYDGERYYLEEERPKSIGRIKGFLGNVGVLIRSYCYIRIMGRDGLKEASEQAVLSSNYLLKRLDSDNYPLPYAAGSPNKHEFVVSSAPLKRKGVKASDVAKALLDEGLHAPTIYFPLTVEEALMIEPTDTEPVELLDAYAEALNAIAKRSADEVKASPKRTSVGRIDEVKASHPKSMVLNWRGLVR